MLSFFLVVILGIAATAEAFTVTSVSSVSRYPRRVGFLWRASLEEDAAPSNVTTVTTAPKWSGGGWSSSSNMETASGFNEDDSAPCPSFARTAPALKEQEKASRILTYNLTDYDKVQVESYWDELLPSVSYLGSSQAAKVYHALEIAYAAHRGQWRKSGEPFIIHPVQVSYLLACLKMDAETVMAGLLHDTVEDTELTFDQVQSEFGATVRTIVEGETKVSKLPKMMSPSKSDEQAENLRQMFVAMTADYRIIIVKLADRLHNMRTLRHMKPEKQIRISRETLDIFAPLAHRMGIWQFKSELEDTAFKYLYPVEYKRLNRRLRQHQTKFRETLEKSQQLLQSRLQADPTLKQQAAQVQVYGRTKELYSLWHKMETKGVRNLDHIVDVVALRVIITPEDADNSTGDDSDEDHADRGVWLCYHVLGLVQHLPGFQPVPTRVKDYISFPKPNGYQSLHTALILNGQTIEVQIRTNRMHQVAEYGMASHWAYTDGKRRNSEDVYDTPWLSSIKEWHNDRISSRDFVDSVRRELLGKRVFVFLRNGKILNLARGATAIDAAFQIHTEVGLHMHGVEINGKPVSFSYELQNGDVVSIQTGQGKPATDWMRYAKSRSTRSKLRAYFRARQRESLREAGHILLMDYLSLHGSLIEKESYLPYSFTIPTDVNELVPFLHEKTRFKTVDELLEAVGAMRDRGMLHKLMSQMFEVPKKALTTAEDERRTLLPERVVREVYARQGTTKDLERKISSSAADQSSESPDSVLKEEYNAPTSVDDLFEALKTREEYADPEQICQDCLPVHGDQIVGTRPADSNVGDTTVHRLGCVHAQRAINQAQADLKIRGLQSIGLSKPLHVDSVTLRRQNGYIWQPKNRSKQQHKAPKLPNELPVKLKWDDMGDDDDVFLTEIVVHCQDRKLLLADCSEVVSDTVEIVRTGSLSTEEHATLIFLVKVTCLHQLQQLMDRLGQVRSVMAVERRFGSELM